MTTALLSSRMLVAGALSAASTVAMASTPPGSMRSAPAMTVYQSPAECMAALEQWVAEQREEERRDPTRLPDQWRLDGPTSEVPGRTTYQLTRLAVQRMDGISITTAYVYEHGCDGATHHSISDGWVGTPEIIGREQ